MTDTTGFLDAYPRSIVQDPKGLVVLTTLLAKGGLTGEQLTKELGVSRKFIRKKLHEYFKGELIRLESESVWHLTEKARFALSEFGFSGIAVDYLLSALKLPAPERRFMSYWLEWKEQTDPASLRTTTDLLRVFSKAGPVYFPKLKNDLSLAIIVGLDPVTSSLNAETLYKKVYRIEGKAGKSGLTERLHKRLNRAISIAKMSDHLVVAGKLPKKISLTDEIYALTAVRFMNVHYSRDLDPRLYLSCKANTDGLDEVLHHVLSWAPSLEEEMPTKSWRSVIEMDKASWKLHGPHGPSRTVLTQSFDADLDDGTDFITPRITAISEQWKNSGTAASKKGQRQAAAHLDQALLALAGKEE